MSSGSYYVPATSRWPILGSLALGALMLGIGIQLVYDTGAPLLVIGLVGVVSVMGLWFRDVIYESMGGLYDAQMDRSFRWGMGWFIFSEVMFFAAFFWRFVLYQNVHVALARGRRRQGCFGLALA